MKSIIASDIHGSATWCKKLVEVIENEQPDYIILLGDLLYHGPRNPLPDGYNPAEVTRMLNAFASHIVAVRGNCDSEVDQMVLDFPCMADYTLVVDESNTLFCTHGHTFSPDNPPQLAPGSFFLSGHTHIKNNIQSNTIQFINPGSVSLPHDGTHSFAIWEKGKIVFRNL